jgi:hypothetical protein
MTSPYVGQKWKTYKILSKTDKTAEAIQTEPKERHRGGGQYETINEIVCERYLRPSF